MKSPLFHYVMILLYIENSKMAMVNFHFLQFFRISSILHRFGQNSLSISAGYGNTTPESKK